MNQIILIDGTSYIFRAFHALPMLVTPSGQHTGAIFGFCSMVKKLLADHPKIPFVFFFDAGGQNFRHQLYADYKAHRKETPLELKQQLELIYMIANLFGVPVVKQQGVEADDLIGTVAQHYASFGDVIISSADKDFCQLISDKIHLENTQESRRITPEQVFEKYGVHPHQFRDYLALLGDSSDNIPGVPKVGKVTAARWLTEYGTLEALLEHAEKLTGKVAESLREHKNNALLSRDLATIQTDLTWPETLPYDCFPDLPNPDLQSLAALYEELEFKTLLPKKLFVEKKAPQIQLKLVDSLELLKEILPTLETQSHIALDIETTALNPRDGVICGLALCASHDIAYYIASHDPSVLSTVLAWLKEQFLKNEICWIAHNWKFEAAFFDSIFGTLPKLYHDTMIMSYVLQPQRKHDLKSLALDFLSWKLNSYEEVLAKYSSFDQVPLDEAARYAASDAGATYLLYYTFSHQLESEPELFQLYNNLERPFTIVLMKMEQNGIQLDQARLLQLEQDIKAQLVMIAEKITAYSGDGLNINSPKQLRALLFEQLKLPVLRKTPKGEPSTDEDVLLDLKNEHPIIALILEYRHLEKLRSTYTTSLIHQVSHATQRLHTTYLQTGTVTGRLSSVNPNLQNIPVKSAYGRKIRESFIAKEGWLLVSMDYSQIELRLMAHFSQDFHLLNAYHFDQDIHSKTAATLFNCAIDDVSVEQRQIAKTVNFGLIYGMTAWGLAKQLHIGRDQAQKFIDAYFAQYPGVRNYMESMKKFAAEHGYVATILGRRIPIEVQQKNVAQNAFRAAINGPLQGTAADLIKSAMIKIHAMLDGYSDQAQLLLQVHDELIFEIKEEFVEHWIKLIKPVMEQALHISVPITVNVQSDHQWS